MHDAMRKISILGLAAWLCSAPAYAIVGGGTPQVDGIARAIVTIVGSRGSFCTGTLIAPTVVLTAAHCVQPGAVYKLAETGSDGKPQLADTRAVTIHPAFNLQAMTAHRATADVALLQLQNPPQGKSPAALAPPLTITSAGTRLTVAGIGVTIPGSGKSAGSVRVASLAVTGKPGTLQVRLVDPTTGGTREGIGACTGDSGGPVIQDGPDGPRIVGVISWSTGPNAGPGCGGLTGVTPLTLYRDWVLQTVHRWGAPL